MCNTETYDIGYFYDDRHSFDSSSAALEVKGLGDIDNLGKELRLLIASYGLGILFNFYTSCVINDISPLIKANRTCINYISTDLVKKVVVKDTKRFAPPKGNIYIYALKDNGLYVAKNGSTYKKLA